jgi:hypothetical protein
VCSLVHGRVLITKRRLAWPGSTAPGLMVRIQAAPGDSTRDIGTIEHPDLILAR